MTQKELLYVEDAISHERIIIDNIKDYINCLQDEELINFMKRDLKTHEKIETNLMKLLEVESNE